MSAAGLSSCPRFFSQQPSNRSRYPLLHPFLFSRPRCYILSRHARQPLPLLPNWNGQPPPDSMASTSRAFIGQANLLNQSAECHMAEMWRANRPNLWEHKTGEEAASLLRALRSGRSSPASTRAPSSGHKPRIKIALLQNGTSRLSIPHLSSRTAPWNLQTTRLNARRLVLGSHMPPL